MTTSNVPKHLEIYSLILSDIEGGQYSNGQKMPTEAELGCRFGVSRPTISRALGILEQQGHLTRRRGSGTYVNRSEAVSTKLFGLLMPGSHQGGIASPIGSAVADKAESTGHAVLLAGSLDSGDDESTEWAIRFCDQFIERKVSGVFYAPLQRLTDEEMLINSRIVDRFQDAGIAVVLFDRDIFAGTRRSRFDLIASDNRLAGYDVTRHLIEVGCRKIVFYVPPEHMTTSSVVNRIEGYRSALREAGLSDSEQILQGAPRQDPSTVEELLRIAPDGLVCVNDHLSRDIMYHLALANVKVPDQMRIASFDDLPFAATMAVPLSSWHQPFSAIARTAVDIMLDRIAHPDQPPRQILLAGEMKVRRSSVPNE